MEQKPFFDHFKELNQRIILSIVVLVSAFVLFYINYTDIYNLLTNPLVEAGYTKADLVAFTIYEGFQVKISNTLLVSFIGTFPIEKPKYLLFVIFDEPKKENKKNDYYGGNTAAPVFSNIVSQIAPILQIKPKREKNIEKVVFKQTVDN